ncbi:hypothetical protein DBV15_09932 [Temnothorax longispinosus]|uniref:Uncharacterized protein n=1 Tax=Temnothorax longispinosus TaxID=300112 RepID=A0A4S2KH48_9HYME|nr:hypothetical protein DBV15_09932 [Temnothorax longispinosus]
MAPDRSFTIAYTTLSRFPTAPIAQMLLFTVETTINRSGRRNTNIAENLHRVTTTLFWKLRGIPFQGRARSRPSYRVENVITAVTIPAAGGRGRRRWRERKDPSVSLFPGILQRSKATPSLGISSLRSRHGSERESERFEQTAEGPRSRSRPPPELTHEKKYSSRHGVVRRRCLD